MQTFYNKGVIDKPEPAFFLVHGLLLSTKCLCTCRCKGMKMKEVQLI